MIDRATVVGLLAIVGLLVWIIASGLGASADVFWQTPSLALVVGGAILATLVACPNATLGSFPAVLRNAFRVRTMRPEESIITLVALAEIARRDGLLALEKPVSGLEDGFLKRAMQMAIDGTDPKTIENVMQVELESIDLRHTEGKGLLETTARFAPAFGMIGTLIGLVLMLARMNDPTTIGPGMAVALLTTLYGLVLANVFCLPLARRLGHRSSEELLAKTIGLKGVLAIQAGDNPRVVAQKLRAYLPAAGEGHDFSWASLSKRASSEREVAASRSTPAKSSARGAKSKRGLDEAAAEKLAKKLERHLKASRRFEDAA